MARFARQVDFDGLVNEFVGEGAVVEEATVEAAKILQDSGFDLSYIFQYQNDYERGEKEKMESRCRTVESAASGTESIVNALFALQGIKQVLTSRTGSQDFLGAWRIIEARQMVKTSLSLVPMPTDEDIMEAETPEEDENDEDEDENCSQITISIIDFVLFIAQSIRQSPDRIRSFEEMFTLDPPTMQLICKRLDEDSADKRIVLRILDLLSVSFAYPQNISNFLESSGVDLLDLVAKMHKKDEIVQKQISYLMTCIS